MGQSIAKQLRKVQEERNLLLTELITLKGVVAELTNHIESLIQEEISRRSHRSWWDEYETP